MMTLIRFKMLTFQFSDGDVKIKELNEGPASRVRGQYLKTALKIGNTSSRKVILQATPMQMKIRFQSKLDSSEGKLRDLVMVHGN